MQEITFASVRTAREKMVHVSSRKKKKKDMDNAMQCRMKKEKRKVTEIQLLEKNRRNDI
jgi:hypothetical protein